VTSLAAESLPDGKAYYQAKILEYHDTLTLTPEEIHAIGLSGDGGIHAEMLAAMQASGFKGAAGVPGSSCAAIRSFMRRRRKSC
jgi:uncharacterized protein (DUF885 family)